MEELTQAEEEKLNVYLSRLDPALEALRSEIGDSELETHRHGPLRALTQVDGRYRAHLDFQPKGRRLSDGVVHYVSADNYHDEEMLEYKGFIDFNLKMLKRYFKGEKLRQNFKHLELDADFKIPEVADDILPLLRRSWDQALELREALKAEDLEA